MSLCYSDTLHLLWGGTACLIGSEDSFWLTHTGAVVSACLCLILLSTEVASMFYHTWFLCRSPNHPLSLHLLLYPDNVVWNECGSYYCGNPSERRTLIPMSMEESRYHLRPIARTASESPQFWRVQASKTL